MPTYWKVFFSELRGLHHFSSDRLVLVPFTQEWILSTLLYWSVISSGPLVVEFRAPRRSLTTIVHISRIPLSVLISGIFDIRIGTFLILTGTIPSDTDHALYIDLFVYEPHSSIPSTYCSIASRTPAARIWVMHHHGRIMTEKVEIRCEFVNSLGAYATFRGSADVGVLVFFFDRKVVSELLHLKQYTNSLWHS